MSLRMLVDQYKVDGLLGNVPLSPPEYQASSMLRRLNTEFAAKGSGSYNSWYDNGAPLYSRERWYAAERAAKLGAKTPTLPEVLDGGVPGTDNSFIRNSGTAEVTPRVRLLSIAEFLFSGDMEYLDIMVPDSERRTVNRLEGELRRYGAREKGQSPKDTPLSRGLITEYCTRYSLEGLVPLMMEALFVIQARHGGK